MDVQLRDLRLFTVLADDPHFSRAAATARVSQPTLTRSLARLEAALGVQLVARTTRSVVLTASGERLRDELESVLPRLDTALRAVSDHPTLRLGFTWLLPSELVREVTRRYELTTGGTIELVRRDDRSGGVLGGHTDAAVVHDGGRRSAGLRVVPLASEPRIVAVARGHALSRRRRVTWAELAEHPLVVNAGSGTVGPALWPASARPAVAVSTRTYDEWIEMVAADRGVGVLPRSARSRPHPGVRYVDVPDAPPSTIVLVRPARAGHPHGDVLEELALRVSSRQGLERR
ncbi:LysR family transcriptional regulator [Terrabacter aerolatus]|uniref:LysR family transcriptional regulator n=1 Tax=Terrabacter aerolatus TaxID=422442 RepID=A0A512D5I6_9MICO|nr:LysR family transcriptional regulator [Terrabacter aerolatus]GEO31725.1 LysR family transcriptional regulator [Terrabacter aerolatus]